MPPSAPSSSPEFPSYEILLRYLSALDYHGRGEDSVFAWQTFDDTDAERIDLLSLRHGTLAEQWPRLCALNRGGAGVHVGIHVTDGKGRRKENILAPRTVVLDFDEGEPIPATRMVPPSMVVRSARGPHYYWLLAEGKDLAQWRRIQLGLARRYKADTQACVFTQTIRAPGFFHNKKEPFPIRIEHLELRRYTLDELFKGFVLNTEVRQIRAEEAEMERRAEEAKSRIPSHRIDLYTNRLERARAYLDHVSGSEIGGRNNATAKHVVPIGWRFGIERDVWLSEVMAWNESHNRPPLDHRHVQSCVFSMWDFMARTSEPFGSLLDVDSPAWKERQAQWEEKLRQRKEEEEAQWQGRLDQVDGGGRKRAAEAQAIPQNLPGVRFVDLLDLPSGALPAMPDGHPLSPRGDTHRVMLSHGDVVRYCKPLDRWFMWTGDHWSNDRMGLICNLLQQTISSVHELRDHPTLRPHRNDDDEEKSRKAAVRSEISKHVARAEKPSALKEVLEFLTFQPRIVVLPEQLDKDDLLVNTPSGIVDVATLEVRPHDPRLCQTRITGAPYVVASSKCDLWHSFIRWAMCEDEEVLSFLQRAAGVSLTGSAEDHVFFVCFGTGGNGKSTFVETMLALAGGYGKVCDFNMFLENDRRSGQPNEELLALKDVRMVFAAEPEEGRRLREDVIKRVTGGEPISARPLFGSPIEFKPKFSLWLSANHRPAIRGTDDGIWRRVVMIPWDAKITAEKKDTLLGQKLLGELPGILRWVLEGANSWHKNGLRIPDKVRSATTAYREDMDEIGSFLQSQTVSYESAKVPSSRLYEVYRRWCEQQGSKAFKQKTFNQRVEERGYARSRSRYGIYFLGLGLLHSDAGEGGGDDNDRYADDERRAIQEESGDDAADDARARERGRGRGQQDLC